ncbi:MAG TPA: PA2778 family cysteine peptidase [Magnetospirillum sp.]|jgi:hypothetical protein|nr:PA2778 family cysteine peptidase [Magnetospirillum sp.]
MRVLQAMLCVVMLAGCSGGWPRLAGNQDAAGHVRVAGVPYYPQEGFRCGPAAMAMVLDWTGLDLKPAALEGQFYGVRDPRATLADAANRYGRLAYPISGTQAMMTELTAGHPVVAVQNLGVPTEPLWNCVVAIGYDRGDGQVLVHSGDQAGKRMSLRLFERLWADTEQWGLVVLKPGDLPAAASRPDYIKAAHALQTAGRYWEAVLAYDAALATWANDPDSLMGLGSSLYLLGDARGAADAYRAAVTVAADKTLAQAALDQITGELARNPDAFPVPQQRPAKGRRTVKEATN